MGAQEFLAVFSMASHLPEAVLMESDGGESSGGEGGYAVYHDPGMSQSILAPDACFNYK